MCVCDTLKSDVTVWYLSMCATRIFTRLYYTRGSRVSQRRPHYAKLLIQNTEEIKCIYNFINYYSFYVLFVGGSVACGMSRVTRKDIAGKGALLRIMLAAQCLRVCADCILNLTEKHSHGNYNENAATYKSLQCTLVFTFSRCFICKYSILICFVLFPHYSILKTRFSIWTFKTLSLEIFVYTLQLSTRIKTIKNCLNTYEFISTIFDSVGTK